MSNAHNRGPVYGRLGTTIEREYHVVVINQITGRKVYMTGTPVSHREGCTILRKLSNYPWRRKQLEEVVP